ncbi:unnamed protein product [Phytomonas sp. Hart1]|nr:unnamed protein product [Phytomonas sp. Hart1]|eukprot:CCW71665.1 unnamed protein product [Phytomonas sp. isolate Hart1]
MGARFGEATSLNGLGYLHAIGFLHHEEKASTSEGAEGALPDYETAVRYFNQSRMQGSVEGAYNLGVLYRHGRGVATDEIHAGRLFQVAAAHGSVLALWQLGQQRQAAGDCHGAVESFRMLLEHGSWVDPFLQGQRMPFASDTDTSQRITNENEGGDEEAPARRRSVEALRALSRIQRVLRGVDPVPVFVRFLEALLLAEMGHPTHAFTAATLLEEQLDVVDEEVPETALIAAGVVEPANPSFVRGNQIPPELTTRASPGRITLFWEFPAVVYATPEANTTTVVPWWLSQKEAKNILLLRLLGMCGEKHSEARLRIGNFYYYGESPLLGVNYDEAFQHYQAAAERESAQAMFNLGFMYQVGLGGLGRGEANSFALDSTQSPAEAEFDDVFFMMPQWCAVEKGGRALRAWHPTNYTPAPGSDSPHASLAFPLDDVAALNRARSRGMLMTTFWRVLHADPDLFDEIELNLAKEYYERTLAINPRVSFAVKLALFSVNLQWWWMYFSLIPAGFLRMWLISMPFYKPFPGFSGKEVCFVSVVGLRECVIDQESTWGATFMQYGFFAPFIGLHLRMWRAFCVVWPWIEAFESFVGYSATFLLFVLLVLRHHAI